MTDPIRLWFLTNSPSPYQLEFLCALAETGRCQPIVRFMQRRHRGGDPLDQREFPFAWAVLEKALALGNQESLVLHRGVRQDIETANCHVSILSGLYTSPTFLLAARHLHRQQRPWGMWLERPWPSDYHPSWTRRAPRPWLAFRNRLLRHLLSRSRLTLCIGSAAVDAYARIQGSDRALVNFPYHSDTSRFPGRGSREASRLRFQLDDSVVFLFSGSLIPRKGCDLLLQTFCALNQGGANAQLLIAGDGPDRPTLEASLTPPIAARVRFLGHCEQVELPAIFAAADVFVLPSRHDGWGVVLNEAAAAGLPIIATDSTGAAHDLVDHGRNGFRIPRDDTAALLAAMQHFIDHPGIIPTMGAVSRGLVAPFDTRAGAHRLCDVLDAVLQSRKAQHD